MPKDKQPPSSSKAKLPGPETREAAWKKSAAQLEHAHEAFAVSAAAHQQVLETLAPALKEKLGIDLAAVTKVYREAFERLASDAEKRWR